MGKAEQIKHLEDENTILKEQIAFLEDYSEDLHKYLEKSVKQVYEDARLLLHIPEEVLADARGRVALEDGDEVLRGLHGNT